MGAAFFSLIVRVYILLTIYVIADFTCALFRSFVLNYSGTVVYEIEYLSTVSGNANLGLWTAHRSM